MTHASPELDMADCAAPVSESRCVFVLLCDCGGTANTAAMSLLTKEECISRKAWGIGK